MFILKKNVQGQKSRQAVQDVKIPVSDWLRQHARLCFWNQNRKAEIDQLYSQWLLLTVDKHHIVWFNVSVQDSDIPQGFQSHQKLQWQIEKTVNQSKTRLTYVTGVLWGQEEWDGKEIMTL